MNLIERISAPRRYLQTNAGVIAPKQGLGPREWIIPRALTLYRCFELKSVPTAERWKNLAVLMRQWSPYEQTDSCSVWDGDHAQVWIWDKAKLKAAMREAGVHKAHVLPETLLYPRLEHDGIRLLQCMHGFEAQYWKDGTLIQSHWWQSEPDIHQWRKFSRSCSQPAPDSLPEIDAVAISSRPWGRVRRTQPDTVTPTLRFGIVAVFFLVAGWLGWESGALWQWTQAVKHLEQQVNALNQQLLPVLQAETHALDDARAIEKYQDLFGRTSQLELISLVFVEAPSQGDIKPYEWKYAQGRLDVTVTGTNLVPSDLVNHYESLANFQEVSVTSGDVPNSMVIQLKLTGGMSR